MAGENKVKDPWKVVAAVKELSLLKLKDDTKKSALQELERGGIYITMFNIFGGRQELMNAFDNLGEDKEVFATLLKNVLAYDTENAEVYLRVISAFLEEKGRKKKNKLSLARTLKKLAADKETAEEEIKDITLKFADKAVQDAVKLYEETKTETLQTQKKPLLKQLVAKVNTLEKLRPLVALKQGEEAAKRVDQSIFSVKAIVFLVNRGIAHDINIKKLDKLDKSDLLIGEVDEHLKEDSPGEYFASTLKKTSIIRAVVKSGITIVLALFGKLLKGITLVLALFGKLLKGIFSPFKALLSTNEPSVDLLEMGTFSSSRKPTAGQLNALKTSKIWGGIKISEMKLSEEESTQSVESSHKQLPSTRKTKL